MTCGLVRFILDGQMHLGASGDLLYGIGVYPLFVAAGKTAIPAVIAKPI